MRSHSAATIGFADLPAPIAVALSFLVEVAALQEPM